MSCELDIRWCHGIIISIRCEKRIVVNKWISLFLGDAEVLRIKGRDECKLPTNGSTTTKNMYAHNQKGKVNMAKR